MSLASNLSSKREEKKQGLNLQGYSVRVKEATDYHFFSSGAGESVMTDLMVDPRSRAMVLNGKPGHLQFYSLQRDKLLYNVSTLLYKLSLRFHMHASPSEFVDYFERLLLT